MIISSRLKRRQRLLMVAEWRMTLCHFRLKFISVLS